MSEQKNSSGWGCMSGLVFAVWLFGAVIVGAAAWEAGESWLNAAGIGVSWPIVLPFVVVEFLGDSLGG